MEDPSAAEKCQSIGPQFNEQKKHIFSCRCLYPPLFTSPPMTVLEAWAYGLPVLMTPQCNSDGFQRSAAIKIDTNNKAIVSGLLQLFSLSEAERKEMGNHGLVPVKQRSTWKRSQRKCMLSTGGYWGEVLPECVRFD